MSAEIRRKRTTPAPTSAVEIWLASSADVSAALRERLCDSLDAKERERVRRIRVSEARDEVVLAHALLRQVLSRHASRAPLEWRFVRNRYGKPEIHPDLNPRRLRFSLSHTRGIVGCAIATHSRIGFDLQNNERPPAQVEDIARRFFSAREVAWLDGLTAEARIRAFYDLWTLKEAYIKGRGAGLSLPLDAFSFQPDVHDELGIRFAAAAGAGRRPWRFALDHPSRAHHLAVGLEGVNAAPALRVHRVRFASDGILEDERPGIAPQ